MTPITKTGVEAAIGWIASLGWNVGHGTDITPDFLNAGHDDHPFSLGNRLKVS